MKKFLTCLIVLSLFSGLALAAPAVRAAAAPSAATVTKLDITTVVKEYSTAQFPGVLVPGSLMGTSVFVSDYANFPDVALFEYLYGNTFGIISMNTDFGQIGLSVNPTPYTALEGPNNGIYPNYPDDVIGLQWGKKIGDMPVGVAISYGTDKSGYQILDVGSNWIWDNDTHSQSDQYMSARGGISMNGLDLSLGVALNNYLETNELWVNADTWNYWEQFDTCKLLIDLAARMELGSGFTGYASISWLNGSDKYYFKSGAWYGEEDYLDEHYNSRLSAEAYVGKNIKAGENLLIRLALGARAGGDTDNKFRHTDYLDPTGSYVGNYSQDSTSFFEIPLNVAVEGKLNDTWSFNTGVQVVLLSLTGTKTAGNTDNYFEKIRLFEEGGSLNIDPGLAFAVGLTGVIGDLKIDMFLNPGIFITGPYFLGGAGAGSLNSGVAFTYQWK